MSKREINKRRAVVKPVCVREPLDDAQAWLCEQANNHGLNWLLAHADDGVIWGRMEGDELLVAPEPPPLCSETLQQARLFSENGELLLWRDGENAFHARLIRECAEAEDASAAFTEAFDELQMLWGTDAKPLEVSRFSVMSDGSRGLRHVVPLCLEGHFGEEGRPLRLRVRHYLQEDESGFVRVAASRLVELLALTEEAT